MPFREKIAWMSLISTVIVWGGFFAFMAATGARMPGMVYFVAFVGAVIVQAVLMTIAAGIAALLAVDDAQSPADERDRAIGRRSSAIAYPVLIALVFTVAGGLHLGFSARDMAYGIMAAIALAEVVHYAAQIAGYRRGWHG